MNNTKSENIVLVNKGDEKHKGFNFDFLKNTKIFIIIAVVLFVGGITSFFVRGFNWDIDFTGGTVMQYNMHKTLESSDIDKIGSIVESATGFKASTIQRAGAAKDQVIIKTKQIDTEVRDAVFTAIAAEFNLNSETDIFKVDNINPTVGKTLTYSTIMAVTLAVVLMLLYITIRFDFFSGVSAIICLIHDLFVMLTFYSLFQIPMNIAVIAAFLTILGYSINATIIVFDRIRENMKLKAKLSFRENVNTSINQTLARSINTTITTLVTITMVYILGVQSIRDFVLPLIVGIISGLYTSVCLAGSLWNGFKSAKGKK